MKLILLSGGLDSTTLLHETHSAGEEVFCLLVDYQQRHKRELLFAEDHCAKLGVQSATLELPNLGGLTQESWIVPNRNLILISIAANVASKIGADSILIGCNADDSSMFPDCRTEFIQAAEKAIRSAGYNITVSAPYLELSKRQIAEKAKAFGIKSNSIWTCYCGRIQPCGKCPACLKLSESQLQ